MRSYVLGKYFSVPDLAPAVVAGSTATVSGGTGTPFFGTATKPPTLSDAEWKDLQSAQAALDALFDGKRPVSNSDVAKAQKSIAQQTALWSKAISGSQLTPVQRYQLQLKLPTLPAPPGRATPPTLSMSPGSGPQTPSDPAVTPETSPLGAWLGDQLSSVAESGVDEGLDALGEAAAEQLLGKSTGYGEFKALAQIAVAYKQEGTAGAMAESANWLIGQIPLPQAGFAVWGGRFGASIAFEALNKFMTDAMSAVGVEFDKDKFWAQVREDANTWKKAVMDFAGAPKGADG